MDYQHTHDEQRTRSQVHAMRAEPQQIDVTAYHWCKETREIRAVLRFQVSRRLLHRPDQSYCAHSEAEFNVGHEYPVPYARRHMHYGEPACPAQLKTSVVQVMKAVCVHQYYGQHREAEQSPGHSPIQSFAVPGELEGCEDPEERLQRDTYVF